MAISWKNSWRTNRCTWMGHAQQWKLSKDYQLGCQLSGMNSTNTAWKKRNNNTSQTIRFRFKSLIASIVVNNDNNLMSQSSIAAHTHTLHRHTSFTSIAIVLLRCHRFLFLCCHHIWSISVVTNFTEKILLSQQIVALRFIRTLQGIIHLTHYYCQFLFLFDNWPSSMMKQHTFVAVFYASSSTASSPNFRFW